MVTAEDRGRRSPQSTHAVTSGGDKSIWILICLAVAAFLAAVTFALSTYPPRQAVDHPTSTPTPVTPPGDSDAAWLVRMDAHRTEPPRSAPDVSVRDLSGRELNLGQLRGKLVVVNFWGTSCGHCLAELPRWERLAREFNSDRLVLLSICADETDVNIVRAAAGSAEKLVYLDPAGLARLRYDVQALPKVVVIDPQGWIVMEMEGVGDWTSNDVHTLSRLYPSFDKTGD